MICTGDVNSCGPRPNSIAEERREKLARTRGQRWMTRHRDLVGVRVAAETRREVQSDLSTKQRAHGGISSEGDAASEGGITAWLLGRASAMEAKRTPGVNRSDEQSPARGIGCEFVSVGKIDGYAGSNRPLTSSTASVARSPERFAAKQEDSGAGCAGRLLLWPRKRTKCETTQIIPRNKLNRKKRRKDMRGIVVENLIPMKAVRANLRKNRTKEKTRTTCQPAGKPGHPEKREQLGIDLIIATQSFRNIEGASVGIARYRDGPKRIARRKCRK